MYISTMAVSIVCKCLKISNEITKICARNQWQQFFKCKIYILIRSSMCGYKVKARYLVFLRSTCLQAIGITVLMHATWPYTEYWSMDTFPSDKPIPLKPIVRDTLALWLIFSSAWCHNVDRLRKYSFFFLIFLKSVFIITV